MKKFRLILLILLCGILTLSCDESTTTTAEPGVVLANLIGKTRQEIIDWYAEVDLTIVFREIQTAQTPAEEFIRYVGYNAGDSVPSGSTVRIEIAVPTPTAPVLSGVTDVEVFVSVQGNPPTFDLQAGITATDYLGNDIPWGNYLYILSIKDKNDKVLSNINFYQLGDYYVTYVAQNSLLSTTIVRKISVIVPPFDTNATDGLRLSAAYVGSSFIDNGIGECVVTTFTDGDTTNFRDVISGDRFTVRYLGIDAPEATSKYDPWGIKAATFVRETLSGAEKIILQAEGEREDGNGRYLAWVWYVKNGVTRLLNLELVELAYAWGSGASSTQYGSVFTVAAAETQLTGRRIYGEEDPDYDYSTEGTPIVIGTLLDNFTTYVGKKVSITGIVTCKVGNSFYVEQNNRGVYVYAGYNLTNELQIGYEVTIQGLVPAVYFEGKQLSNYSASNMQLLSTDNPITITTIFGSQVSGYLGRVVHYESLVVQSVEESDDATDKAYTVTAQDAYGTDVNIRVDHNTAQFVQSYLFAVGTEFSVTGPITQFYSTYQLMLPGTGNIEFK